MSRNGTNHTAGAAAPAPDEALDEPGQAAVGDADTIPPQTADAPEGADAPESPDAADTEATEEPKPPPPPPRTLADILRDQLAEKEKQLHEYIAAYKDAKRDMDERMARVRRDREKLIDRDRKQLSSSLLEVLDNLDRSITAMADPSAAQGLRMVHRQFAEVLTEFGVERMTALGERFDANLHEAIGMVPAHGDQVDQQIVHVDRAGYRFKGELLRAARVVVATRG
jgi:molecular chaperone GrpE